MKKVRIICRAIILNIKKDSIVLVRNKKAKFWYPPGGGWQPGEDMVSCVSREVLEETGLRISLEKFLFIQQFSPNPEEIHLEMFWLAYIKKGSVLPKSHVDKEGIVEESRCFSKEQLISLKVFPTRLKKQLWNDIEILSSIPNQFLTQKKGGRK